MSKKAVAISLLVLGMVLPTTVVASHTTDCGDDSIAEVGGFYVADDGVWEESNGADGLQRSGCDADDDHTNGNEVAPDTKVL